MVVADVGRRAFQHEEVAQLLGGLDHFGFEAGEAFEIVEFEVDAHPFHGKIAHGKADLDGVIRYMLDADQEALLHDEQEAAIAGGEKFAGIVGF